MKEEYQVIAVVLTVLVIGIVGLLLTDGLPGVKSGTIVNSDYLMSYGDLYVDNYNADLYLNGTLDENYLYKIGTSGKYRMLYRIWKLPISKNDKTLINSSFPGRISNSSLSQKGVESSLVKSLGPSSSPWRLASWSRRCFPAHPDPARPFCWRCCWD